MITFDPDGLTARLASLEEEMGRPGFWGDQEQAAKVSAEHSRTQRKLDSYRRLESDVDDLEALEELAAEDESLADELQEQRQAVAARLSDLELERLFSGPYDAGDAVVTVNFFMGDYGLGAPFVPIGSEVVTLTTGEMSKITPAHSWTVPAGASAHSAFPAPFRSASAFRVGRRKRDARRQLSSKPSPDSCGFRLSL